MSFFVVSSPAIRAIPFTKVLPSAASIHHFSAGLAAIACWCDPLPVPVLGALSAGDRTEGPGSVRQDTVNWNWGNNIVCTNIVVVCSPGQD